MTNPPAADADGQAGGPTMTRATSLILCLLAAVMAAAATPAVADDSGVAEREGWRGSLTLGVGARPDYEGSDAYEAVPVPMARLEWRGFGFYAQGTRALFDVTPQRQLLAGPLLNYRFARDDVSDPRVDALPEVDGALEAGVFLGARLPTGDDPRQLLIPMVTFQHDVSGAHDGWLATARVSNTFVLLRPLALELAGSLSYASEDYQQSYFGIGPAGAAASGLAPYSPGAGFKDVSLQATLDLYVSETWSFGPTVIYSRLLGDAADSPLVEEAGSANQFTGFLSATWRF